MMKIMGGRRLNDEEEREIRRELAELREEHRDLDAAIAALAEEPMPDTIRLQRLKKRKLALKDRIAKLDDRLLPDIIACPPGAGSIAGHNNAAPSAFPDSPEPQSR